MVGRHSRYLSYLVKVTHLPRVASGCSSVVQLTGMAKPMRANRPQASKAGNNKIVGGSSEHRHDKVMIMRRLHGMNAQAFNHGEPQAMLNFPLMNRKLRKSQPNKSNYAAAIREEPRRSEVINITMYCILHARTHSQGFTRPPLLLDSAPAPATAPAAALLCYLLLISTQAARTPHSLAGHGKGGQDSPGALRR